MHAQAKYLSQIGRKSICLVTLEMCSIDSVDREQEDQITIRKRPDDMQLHDMCITQHAHEQEHTHAINIHTVRGGKAMAHKLPLGCLSTKAGNLS